MKGYAESVHGTQYRSSHPEVFLEKGVLKICGKYTGEHPYQRLISIKLQSKFTEIILRHGCSPVNLLYIFRILLTKSTSGRLLLIILLIIVCIVIIGIGSVCFFYLYVKKLCQYGILLVV